MSPPPNTRRATRFPSLPSRAIFTRLAPGELRHAPFTRPQRRRARRASCPDYAPAPCALTPLARPLRRAAQHRWQVPRLLLGHGASVGATLSKAGFTFEGMTPIHCAAWEGHADIVELLLDYGVSSNALALGPHKVTPNRILRSLWGLMAPPTT